MRRGNLAASSLHLARRNVRRGQITRTIQADLGMASHFSSQSAQPSFTYASAQDPLDAHTLKAIAVGVSTRQYARTLDPLPAELPERFAQGVDTRPIPSVVGAPPLDAIAVRLVWCPLTPCTVPSAPREPDSVQPGLLSRRLRLSFPPAPVPATRSTNLLGTGTRLVDDDGAVRTS